MGDSAVTKNVLEEILDRKLHPLLSTIGELQKSMDFINHKYELMKTELVTTTKELNSLKSENTLIKNELLNLQNEVKIHKDKLDEAEQYGWRECLEFRGVPVSVNEDTSEIIANIASLLDLDIRRDDISISHRIKPKNPASNNNSPPPIIAKFIRREERDEFYQARKRLKDYSTKDLEGVGRLGDNKIYISESLTRKNKELFNEALKLKKEFHFKFIWTFYGRIFLRKDERSPSLVISSQKDLEILKNKCSS